MRVAAAFWRSRWSALIRTLVPGGRLFAHSTASSAYRAGDGPHMQTSSPTSSRMTTPSEATGPEALISTPPARNRAPTRGCQGIDGIHRRRAGVNRATITDVSTDRRRTSGRLGASRGSSRLFLVAAGTSRLDTQARDPTSAGAFPSSRPGRNSGAHRILRRSGTTHDSVARVVNLIRAQRRATLGLDAGHWARRSPVAGCLLIWWNHRRLRLDRSFADRALLFDVLWPLVARKFSAVGSRSACTVVPQSR